VTASSKYQGLDVQMLAHLEDFPKDAISTVFRRLFKGLLIYSNLQHTGISSTIRIDPSQVLAFWVQASNRRLASFNFRLRSYGRRPTKISFLNIFASVSSRILRSLHGGIKHMCIPEVELSQWDSVRQSQKYSQQSSFRT
jgi:hypothetical protein